MYEIRKLEEYVKYNELDTRCRRREYIYPRYYIFKYLRYCHNWQFTKIGYLFNVDHSTVIHGLQKFEELSRYQDFKEYTAELSIFFPIISKRSLNLEETNPMGVIHSLLILQKQFTKISNNG